MRYLVLIAYEPSTWADASPEAQAAYHQAHLSFHRAVAAHLVAGEALSGPEAATTLRHEGGRPVLTDGPFAETSEVIGGFYVLDANDLDEVTSWCELLPQTYALEIRPCVHIDGFD